MYTQIINLLNQNNIRYTNLLWIDEKGSLQLDDCVEYTQYIEDPIDKGILFYIGDKKRFFKFLGNLNIGPSMVYLLEEVVNE